MEVSMNKTELIKQLTELVSFKPITEYKQNTRKLLLSVQHELVDLGMKTKLSSSNGFYSLVAGTRSTKHSKVLLQGHIDVVPADGSMFEVKQNGDRLYGRGVCDMLFATSIYICMLRELQAKKSLQDLDLGIMLTSDEEIGGYNGVGRLFKDYSCEVCILPDAGGPTEINTKAKGVLQLSIILTGKAGHAGRPYEYDNPIIKAANFVLALNNKFPNTMREDTVCSISMISAGKAPNQVPSDATVTIDIRFASKDNPHDLVKDIEKIAKKHDGTVKTMCLDDGYDIDINDPFVKRFLDLYTKKTGLNATPIQVPGSSDARFIASKNIPVIMLRPAAGGMHADNEYLSIESFVQFSEVIKTYVLTEAKV